MAVIGFLVRAHHERKEGHSYWSLMVEDALESSRKIHSYRKTPVSNMGPSLEVSRRTPCVITQHGKRRLQESSASSVRDQYRTEDVHLKTRVHDLGKVVHTSMSLKMVLDKSLSN